MKKIILFFILCFAIYGCGLDKNQYPLTTTTTSTPAAAAAAVTGTAAMGAPLGSAIVKFIDRNGAAKSTYTTVSGAYKMYVTGMTMPGIIRVTRGPIVLYGYVPAVGTANVHPYSDLIIRNWAKVKGTTADALFASVGGSMPPATDIGAIESKVRMLISTRLTSVNIDPAAFNLITTPFTADSTGFDKVLDLTKVDLAAGAMTISTKDPVTGAVADTFASMPDSTDLTASTDPLTGALTGVNATLGNIAAAANAKGAALAPADVLAFYDAAFLNDGLDAAAEAGSWAALFAGSAISSYTVKDVISFDAAKSVLRFSSIAAYTDAGGVKRVARDQDDAYIKGADGVWRRYGNQRIAHIGINAGTKTIQSIYGTAQQNVAPINVTAPTGSVIMGTASGPGLMVDPTKLTLESPYAADPSKDALYIASDNVTYLVPPAGSIYTITLTKKDLTTVTYREFLDFTPPTEFISLSGPAGHTLANANFDKATSVSWTLPKSFPIGAVTLSGSVWNSGSGCVNNAIAGAVNSDNATGSVTLPSKCGGSAATGASINVYVRGPGNNAPVTIASYTFGY